MNFLITLMLVGTAVASDCGPLNKDAITGKYLLDLANSAFTNPHIKDMKAVLAIVEKYTDCGVLEGAVAVTQTESCKPLFDAGFCFGAAAALVVPTTWNSYNHLMGHMENVADLACEDASDCAAEATTWATTCFEHNTEEQFLAMGLELAGFYEANYADKVKEMSASAESNTLIKQLIDMVMEKFTSFDSVVAFAKEHVTDDVMADAIEKKNAFLGIASAFCEADCVGVTANFVKQITDKMATSAKCPDAAMFCGAGYNGCKRSANSYIKQNAMPCCLFNTITDVIEQVEDVIATYKERATEAFDATYEALDDTAKALWDLYAAKATIQWNCIKATWATTKEQTCIVA